MTDLAIGAMGFGALFLLMVLRTPVAFAMLLTGFFGTWYVDGLRRAGAVIVTESYSAVATDEPDTAEKAAQPITEAVASQPRKRPTQAWAAS